MRLEHVDNPTPPQRVLGLHEYLHKNTKGAGLTTMAIKEQCLVHTTFGDIDTTMERRTAVVILKADDRELVSIEDADGINLHTMKAAAVQCITFPASQAINLPTR